MKKRKMYLIDKLFDEKINNAICKWFFIIVIVYAVVRTVLHFTNVL